MEESSDVFAIRPVATGKLLISLANVIHQVVRLSGLAVESGLRMVTITTSVVTSL